MAKDKMFRKGSTSYRILFLTIAFITLAVSILSPIFLVEGGNRILGIVLASVIGIIYFLFLVYFIFEWLKSNPEQPKDE